MSLLSRAVHILPIVKKMYDSSVSLRWLFAQPSVRKTGRDKVIFLLESGLTIPLVPPCSFSPFLSLSLWPTEANSELASTNEGDQKGWPESEVLRQPKRGSRLSKPDCFFRERKWVEQGPGQREDVHLTQGPEQCQDSPSDGSVACNPKWKPVLFCLFIFVMYLLALFLLVVGGIL